MTVRTFVRRQGFGDQALSCPGHRIRFLAPDQDAAGVADLAASLAGTASVDNAFGPVGPTPRATGLLAELNGRPGRGVTCWLAWPLGTRDADPGAILSGLVTLVESRNRTGRVRWSIGWVLVLPTARRRGLARALVATAVAHARMAGATEVWTETSARWPALAFWQAVGFVPARSADRPAILPEGFRSPP